MRSLLALKFQGSAWTPEPGREIRGSSPEGADGPNPSEKVAVSSRILFHGTTGENRVEALREVCEAYYMSV